MADVLLELQEGVAILTVDRPAVRNAIGPAEKTIRGELGLTRDETGDAIAGFFLGYTLFMVPAGWLAQRWGPRAALSLFAAAWSLCAASIRYLRGGASSRDGR